MARPEDELCRHRSRVWQGASRCVRHVLRREHADEGHALRGRRCVARREPCPGERARSGRGARESWALRHLDDVGWRAAHGGGGRARVGAGRRGPAATRGSHRRRAGWGADTARRSGTTGQVLISWDGTAQWRTLGSGVGLPAGAAGSLLTYGPTGRDDRAFRPGFRIKRSPCRGAVPSGSPRSFRRAPRCRSTQPGDLVVGAVTTGRVGAAGARRQVGDRARRWRTRAGCELDESSGITEGGSDGICGLTGARAATCVFVPVSGQRTLGRWHARIIPGGGRSSWLRRA